MNSSTNLLSKGHGFEGPLRLLSRTFFKILLLCLPCRKNENVSDINVDSFQLAVEPGGVCFQWRRAATGFYKSLTNVTRFFFFFFSLYFLIQTTSSALKGAIQLGIGYTVGNLTSKPDRDVLMQDFYMVESVFLPRSVFCCASALTRAFMRSG